MNFISWVTISTTTEITILEAYKLLVSAYKFHSLLQLIPLTQSHISFTCTSTLLQEMCITIHSLTFGSLCSHSTYQEGCGSLLFLHPVSPPSLYQQWGGSQLPCLMRRILEILAPAASFLLIITNSRTAFQVFFPPQKALVNLIPWLAFNLSGHCLKQVLLLLISSQCLRTCQFGFLFTHTIYICIPTLSPVVSQARLPAVGACNSCTKNRQHQPSESRTSVHTNRTVGFLHPVFSLEITLDDLTWVKVNQVQKIINSTNLSRLDLAT